MQPVFCEQRLVKAWSKLLMEGGKGSAEQGEGEEWGDDEGGSEEDWTSIDFIIT